MVVSTPPAPPLPEELTAPPHRMRLPHPRNTAPEALATARAQRWKPAQTPRVPLAKEVHRPG